MKFLSSIATAMVLSLAATAASANSEIWYVVPEDRGDCGDECYTPPAAWIDEEGHRYALGVSCDDQLMLGGRATYVSEMAIDSLEMIVDGRSLGRFSVIGGLNDIYIQPTDEAGQPPAGTATALSTGENVVLRFQDGPSFAFTLGGAKAAIALMHRLCQQ
jgi:hypothetical protein